MPKAVRWYRKAAEQSDHPFNNPPNVSMFGTARVTPFATYGGYSRMRRTAAQYKLGQMYDLGVGVAGGTRLKRHGGTAKLLSRVTPVLNMTSVSYTPTARVCRRTMPKP